MQARRDGGRLAGATALLALLAALSTAAAPPSAAPVEFARKGFSRKFDTRRVEHTFTFGADRPLKPGSIAELRVSLSTQLTGSGLGSAPRAGLVDGYVALLLPPELSPAGDLRLYFHDPAGGRDELLYSADFPALARFPDRAALGPLRGADPAKLFAYYASAARALDPTAVVFPPVADALRRSTAAAGGPQGAAWLLPVDMRQRRLLDLFDPQAAGTAPEIVAKLPVKVNADPAAAKVKLFAGALSCAAAELDIPPGLAPPGALPLSELNPRAYPPPPAAADGAQPATVPTLVYSGLWCSWEDDLPLTPGTAPRDALDLPAMPVVDGAPSAAHEAAPGAAERAAPPQDASAAAPPAPAVGAGDASASTAHQVQVGTLPAPGGNDEVPLRPITGSAGQRGSPQDSGYPGPTDGTGLPPAPGFTGTAPGSTRYYGPGGPDNLHGGMSAAAPAPAPPGLGTMVLVPAGEFLMGTDAGSPYGDADELPQHKVNLPAFLIDKYPVTNRQFAQFVVSSAYQPEGDWQRYNSPALLDMPVRCVSWNDANAYAKWAGKRLPSEAEWEKAARGTDGRLYPWGNDWSADILPRGEFSYALVTAPKAASPYGVMAMCGVLWQWTASPWHEYPFDPNARGDKLILRGGAFSNGRNIVRCANRYFEAAGVALNTFSFRCVKDAK